MYIPSFIVQSLHEDRIREGQRTSVSRFTSEKLSASLFSRISQLLHGRGQKETPETRDARHAHAL